jgi:hypothetical protein
VQASVVEFVFGLGEPDVDVLNLWLRRVSEIIDRVWMALSSSIQTAQVNE